jgi:uncharacterized protein (TIGR03437 family)
VTLLGQNLLQPGSAPTVTLTDGNGNVFPLQILRTVSNEIDFAIAQNLTPGFYILKVTAGSASTLPVGVQVNAAPASIVSVTTLTGSVFDASHPASAGDLLSITVTGLDPNVVTAPNRLRVTASGIDLRLLAVQQVGSWIQVQVVVPQGFAGQTVPLTVTQDGTLSYAYAIAIR